MKTVIKLFFCVGFLMGHTIASAGEAELFEAVFPKSETARAAYFSVIETPIEAAKTPLAPPKEVGTELLVYGGGAFPGGTLNLRTKEGWYIVINSDPQEPLKIKEVQAVTFDALVKGVVTWIYRENKIIVLKVRGSNYKVVAST